MILSGLREAKAGAIRYYWFADCSMSGSVNSKCRMVLSELRKPEQSGIIVLNTLNVLGV